MRAGIERDDVFSAMPLLEAVRFLMSLMMTERKVTKTYKMTQMSMQATDMDSVMAKQMHFDS